MGNEISISNLQRNTIGISAYSDRRRGCCSLFHRDRNISIVTSDGIHCSCARADAVVLLDLVRAIQCNTYLATAVTVTERNERQSVNLLATFSRVPVIARLQLFPVHPLAAEVNSMKLDRIWVSFIFGQLKTSSVVLFWDVRH